MISAQVSNGTRSRYTYAKNVPTLLTVLRRVFTISVEVAYGRGHDCFSLRVHCGQHRMTSSSFVAKEVNAMSKAKSPIPEGYHSVTPQLTLDNAAKSIDWYKKALGAEEISRFAGPDGKIMHAELKIGNSRFMANDVMMGGKGPKRTAGRPRRSGSMSRTPTRCSTARSPPARKQPKARWARCRISSGAIAAGLTDPKATNGRSRRGRKT